MKGRMEVIMAWICSFFEVDEHHLELVVIVPKYCECTEEVTKFYTLKIVTINGKFDII